MLVDWFNGQYGMKVNIGFSITSPVWAVNIANKAGFTIKHRFEQRCSLDYF